MPVPLREMRDGQEERRYSDINKTHASFGRERGRGRDAEHQQQQQQHVTFHDPPPQQQQQPRVARDERKSCRRRPDSTPPAPPNRTALPQTTNATPRIQVALSPPPVTPISPPLKDCIASRPIVIKEEEPPTASSTPSSCRDLGCTTPRVGDVLSPKELKKKETIERLQALQAIEERRRYEDLERRVKAMEAGPVRGEGTERKVRQLEGELEKTRTELALLHAETHSLRALVERQSKEMSQLITRQQRGAMEHGGGGGGGGDHGMSIPPPRCPARHEDCLTPDRNDPDWLEKWQQNVTPQGHAY